METVPSNGITNEAALKLITGIRERDLLGRRTDLNAVLSQAETLLNSLGEAIDLSQGSEFLARFREIQSQLDAVQNDPTGQLTLQKSSLQQVLNAIGELSKRTESSKHSNSELNLSTKIQENKDCPESIKTILDGLQSIVMQTEEIIHALPEKTYFESAPALDREIHVRLKAKDELLALLQRERNSRVGTVSVELVPEYNKETALIGNAFNTRDEVMDATAILAILLQKWKESLIYQSSVAQLYVIFNSSDPKSIGHDEISNRLLDLGVAEQRLQKDPQLMQLSSQENYYQEIGKILAKILECRKLLLDAWGEKIASVYFEGDSHKYSLGKMLERYNKKFPTEQSYVNATRGDLDTLVRAVATLENVATTKNWTQDQIDLWATKLSKLIDIREKVRTTLTNKQTEAAERQEISQKKEKLKQDFIEKLEQLSRGPAAVIQTLADTISKRLDPLYEELNNLNKENIFSLAEILEVERRLWIADYIFTKRSLHQTLADNEMNEANKDFYLQQDGYVAQYEGNGFNRLTGLIHKLAQTTEGGEDQVLIKLLEQDIASFKLSIGNRRTFLYAGLYHKGEIIGQVHDGKSVAKIPAAPAPLFPDKDTLVAADRPSQTLPDLSVDGVSLRFAGEHEYNPAGLEREDSLQDFGNPGTFSPIEHFIPSQFGDAKRLLDIMINNLLHTRLAEEIQTQKRTPSAEEEGLIAIFKDYFKSQHLPEWNDVLHKRIARAAEIMYGYTIDPLTVKQAWYSHILKLNQEMLIPGSSQFQDNQIYKANQALTYLLEAIKDVSTSGFDLFRLLMLIGTFSSVEEVNFWISQVVDPSKLSKAKGIIEKIGSAIAGVYGNKHPENMVEVIGEALHEEGLSQYAYLVELPLMETSRTIWGTFPFIPLPMQFALFKDPTGSKLSSLSTETAILRFGTKVEGRDPKPVSAADFVNSKGDIMYELIPHELMLEGTDLQTWFNNGPNFANFYKLYASGISVDDLSYSNLALLFNQDKYAGIGLPGMWGEEIRCGSINPKIAMERVGTTYVLGTCYTLLMSGKIRTFHDLENKLNEGFTKAVSPEATKAVMLLLKRTLGSEAEARAYGEELGKQIEEFLKIR